MYDGSGAIVPYAIRVLRTEHQRHPFPAKEFNRAQGPGGASELTFDLERDDIEHNQVEVDTRGVDFRRKVEVEGGADARTWSKLATANLIRFAREGRTLGDNAVSYPPSRFRYLRIRVFPDPVVDTAPVQINAVHVVRRVEIAGESATFAGRLQERQPVRVDGRFGSAWIVELGGENIPCERIEVEIEDSEFARDYRIEAAGPPDSQQRFHRVALTSEGFWQRRPGEKPQWMIAHFQEVLAARLKLMVIDDGNDPLRIRSVKFIAPVRQVVFERPQAERSGLRLFFGNPKASAPNYDFARNLPTQLDPPPGRGKLGALQRNPDYNPQLPLTERWPWLIYVVLGAVSVVLAALIVSLARAAIGGHDAERADEQATPFAAAGAQQQHASPE